MMENLHGTAGAPMLNILNQRNLVNCLVVVTRYFGGILLGTGGLVRAYTGALQAAIENSQIVTKDIGLDIKIEIDYSEFEKLKYYLNKNDIDISNIEYGELINVSIDFNKEKYDIFCKNLNEYNFKIISNEVIGEKYINVK